MIINFWEIQKSESGRGGPELSGAGMFDDTGHFVFPLVLGQNSTVLAEFGCVRKTILYSTLYSKMTSFCRAIDENQIEILGAPFSAKSSFSKLFNIWRLSATT